MPDSRLLEIFAVVAEELHFRRAAERLHMSQPPLSQAVRRLEQMLGVELLTRTTRSVSLTPAGAELQRRIGRMRVDADAMVHAVRQVAKGEVGQLSIGLTPSAAYSNLPQAMYLFRQRYPLIALELHEMNSSEMPAALLQGRLDIALLRPPFAESDLAPEVIREEAMMLAVRRDHALAGRGAVSLNQLVEHDLIGYSRVTSRYFSQVMHRMLQAARKPARVVQESMIPTILVLVEAGFGAAVVPASLSRIRADAIAYIKLRGPGVVKAELVAARHPANRNPAVEPFLNVIRKTK